MNNTQILVVEDNGIIGENIRRKLKSMGYGVPNLVMFGQEAIETAAEVRPDLVLMDIGLAGEMDGVEAARQIRTRFDIPVVYLTAHTDEATLQRAKTTEPFGYMTKPFELNELRSVIETALYKHQLEKKLKEREAHFRLLYEEAPLAYQSLNEDGCLIEVNQTWLDMLGYEKDEVIGRWFGDFLVPEETSLFKERFPQFKAAGVTHNVEFEMAPKDGTRVTVSINGRIGYDEAGDFRQTHCILHDITAREQTEESLRRSEEKYRKLITEMIGGCALHEIVCDSDGTPIDYITLEVNHAYEKLLEVEREDVIGKKASDILPQPELQHWLEIFGPVALTGESARYQMYSASNQKYFEGTAYRPENGKFAVTFSNITERKRAEEALQKREADLSALIENTDDRIWAVDPQYRLIISNTAFQHGINASFGRELKLGDCVLVDELPEAAREEWQGYYDRALRGEQFTVEIQLRFMPEQYWHNFFNPIRTAAGQIEGVVVIAHNITAHKQAEQALAESEALHRITMENILDPVFITDDAGRFTFICANVSHTLGYTVEEIEAMGNISKLIGDGLPSPEELAALGEITNVERSITDKSGQTHHYLLNIKRVSIKEGTVLYTCHEITERKQAQEALQANEEKLRTLFAILPVGILILDNERRIVEMNPALETILDMSMKDLLAGQYWQRQYLRGDGTPMPASEFASTRAANEQRAVYNVETGVVKEDGEVIWTMVNAALLPDDRIALATMDITGRKRAEIALQKNEETIRALLNATTESALLIDLEGNLLVLNETVANVFGKPLDELLGQCAYNYLPPEVVAFRKKKLKEVVRSGKSLRFEDERLGRIIDNSIYPVFDDEGQIVRVAIFGQDITERTRAEAALQQRSRQLELLNLAGYAFSSSLALEQVLAAVLDEVRHLLLVTACSVWLVDPTSKDLVCQQVVGPQSDMVRGWRLASGQGIAGVTVASGQSVVVPDVRADARHFPDVDKKTGLALRSILSAPLQVKGQVIGVLQAVDTAANRFTPDDVTLLESLAGSAAIAIENARLFEELRSGHNRMQTLSHQLLEVQETERRHIARELHDEVGQILTGLNLLLEISARTPADEVNSRLGEARTMVEELIEKVDELSLNLRPAMLDDLGLLPALLWLAERYTAQTGVQVHLQHTDVERRFAPEIETAAYRVIQEALTNAARHAEVSEVAVQLWADEHTLSVYVEDQGVGFDAEAALAASDTGGLSGMRERAVLLNGQLNLESALGTGTRLTAVWPLHQPAQEEPV
jgi:PAS domain S-box-containing protein